MTHGLFEWVDVSVPDTDAATEFYTRLFGWTVETPADTGYSMFRKDGKLAAGMAAMPPGSERPGTWNSYVTVDSVVAISERASQLGATILVPPGPVGDAGQMTYLQDPQGALLGFWQPGTHRGAEAYNEPGFLTWNGLGTRDVVGSKAFYSALMPEWTFEGVDDGENSGFTMIKLGDRDNAGLGALTDNSPPDTPSHWRVWFVVDDARASLDVVEEAGGVGLGPVVDSSYGPLVRVADPSGASFMIIGPMTV